MPDGNGEVPSAASRPSILMCTGVPVDRNMSDAPRSIISLRKYPMSIIDPRSERRLPVGVAKPKWYADNATRHPRFLSL